eukprot:TRINITY_DN104559_c0_g1_i1.p2 TRINITY_DN104559_c0_g1~~TRINITY_DN104559_c0_g1_i1.p2  ORF type:complete len:102 (-),score=2.58 TRINITY_DN104559_c0_g1_i1:134-409(-)
MSSGDCCEICTQEKDCAYWKYGNDNCYYYALPQVPRIPHAIWQNFSQSHPQSEWTMGLREDSCCSCSAGSGGACGPTYPLGRWNSGLAFVV